jgi:hypothetical protein
MHLQGYFWQFAEVYWETDDIVEGIRTLSPLERRCGILDNVCK